MLAKNVQKTLREVCDAVVDKNCIFSATNVHLILNFESDDASSERFVQFNHPKAFADLRVALEASDSLGLLDRQNRSRLTFEEAFSAISRIAVEAFRAKFAILAFGVVEAKTFSRFFIAKAASFVAVIVAVAGEAAAGRCVAEASDFALFAEFAFGVVFAIVAFVGSVGAS